jgi:hypothetical protein
MLIPHFGEVALWNDACFGMLTPLVIFSLADIPAC